MLEFTKYFDFLFVTLVAIVPTQSIQETQQIAAFYNIDPEVFPLKMI